MGAMTTTNGYEAKPGWCRWCGRELEAPACCMSHAWLAAEQGIASRTFAEDEALQGAGR